MKKISSLVTIIKQVDIDGRYSYRAYWRGTGNRVRRENGALVMAYNHKADLLFDLRNNPMERGVLAY